MTTVLESAVPPDCATAVVFPGITASSFPEIGRFLLVNPQARALIAVADETLGYSVFDGFRAADRAFTEYERVAFLVTCLALMEWARRTWDVQPGICVGPSFGGTAAAVFSGALAFPDAVRLTARWGHCLDTYFARRFSDVVTQSFARIPQPELSAILSELDSEGEWYDVACYVDEAFSMLSVREHRLEWLQRRVRAAGGLPFYTMRPPMHSPSFGELRQIVERELFGGLRFSDPQIPVVSDHDGRVLRTGQQIRTLLLDGIVRPVRWPGAMATLKGRGVEKLYVSGPDGLWGRVPCASRAFEVLGLTPRAALQPRRRAALREAQS